MEVVGSGTRVPAVYKVVEEVFGQAPSRTLNAKEVVSRGCALQCAMLSPTFKVGGGGGARTAPRRAAVRPLARSPRRFAPRGFGGRWNSCAVAAQPTGLSNPKPKPKPKTQTQSSQLKTQTKPNTTKHDYQRPPQTKPQRSATSRSSTPRGTQ